MESSAWCIGGDAAGGGRMDGNDRHEKVWPLAGPQMLLSISR